MTTDTHTQHFFLSLHLSSVLYASSHFTHLCSSGFLSLVNAFTFSTVTVHLSVLLRTLTLLQPLASTLYLRFHTISTSLLFWKRLILFLRLYPTSSHLRLDFPLIRPLAHNISLTTLSFILFLRLPILFTSLLFWKRLVLASPSPGNHSSPSVGGQISDRPSSSSPP